jgi:hypothetical protein
MTSSRDPCPPPSHAPPPISPQGAGVVPDAKFTEVTMKALASEGQWQVARSLLRALPRESWASPRGNYIHNLAIKVRPALDDVDIMYDGSCVP